MLVFASALGEEFDSTATNKAFSIATGPSRTSPSAFHSARGKALSREWLCCGLQAALGKHHGISVWL